MNDPSKLTSQLENSRFRNGHHERLVNGEWQVWPVLAMDDDGRKEVERTIGKRRPA